MAGGQKPLPVFLPVGDVQQPFSLPVCLADGQPQRRRLPGRHLQVLYAAGPRGFAIFQQFPFQGIGGKITEEVLVIDFYLSAGKVAGRCPYTLVEIAHLVHVGVGHAVGAYQAVAAEVIIAGVEFVEIAAVGIHHLAVLARPADALVHEVPDEAALILRVFPREFHVFLESSYRITHRVGVLALDEGFLLGVVLAVGGALLVPVVHGAENVRLSFFPGTLVLHGAACVLRLYPLVRGIEVGAVPRLVTQRPEDDARMIEVALHVALVALHVRLGVSGYFRQRLVAIAHSVRFDVRLGHDVQSVLVAQVIPIVVVRVVAGAHGVYIELLHDLHVLLHPRPRHHVTSVGVHLVTVRPLEDYWLPVDQDLRPAQFDLAETDACGDDLHHTVARLQRGA